MGELLLSKYKVELKLTVDNVGEMYEFLKRVSSRNALDKCLDFVDAHSNELIADERLFCDLPHSLIVEIVSRDTFCVDEIELCNALVEWQRKHVEYDLKALLSNLRWNLISAPEYARHIRPRSFISDEEYFTFSAKKHSKRSRDSSGTENDFMFSDTSMKANIVSEGEDYAMEGRGEGAGAMNDTGNMESGTGVSEIPEETVESTSTSNESRKESVKSQDECYKEILSADGNWSYDCLHRIYKCKKCGRKYTQRGHLETHLNNKHIQKRYNCEKCGLSYSSICQFDDHKKAHEANLTCEICGKTGITSFSTIRDHFKKGRCERYLFKKAKKSKTV